MIESLKYLAASETSSSGDIFGALGIDWKTLILQIIAFLILVFILGKFIYPRLMKSVDERMDKINQASMSFDQAQSALSDAQTAADKILAQARKDASMFLADAKNEAKKLLVDAEEKAKEKTNIIVVNGKKELVLEANKLREELKKETVLLVAEATGTLTGGLVDAKKDEELIKKAISKVK